MPEIPDLESVTNERIQFLTMRPPGSFFAVLERRVVVTAPPEAVEIARRGSVEVLDALVDLLKQPDRAWAAEVMLAAMTRREEKLVDAFATTPERWWGSVGETAHERWRAWLDEVRRRLVWDPEQGAFTVRAPDG
jgi:hypothetical protein